MNIPKNTFNFVTDWAISTPKKSQTLTVPHNFVTDWTTSSGTISKTTKIESNIPKQEIKPVPSPEISFNHYW